MIKFLKNILSKIKNIFTKKKDKEMKEFLDDRDPFIYK